MTDMQEKARQLGGFLWQTLADRGFRLSRDEVEQAFGELSPDHGSLLHQTCVRLSKGGDLRDDFQLASAFQAVAGNSLREILRGNGIDWRADKLLELASGSGTAAPFAAARAGLLKAEGRDEDALARLRQWCGSLLERDLEHRSTTEVHAPQAAPPEPTIRTSTEKHPPPIGTPLPATPTTRPNKSQRQVKVYGKAAALTVERALRADRQTVVMVEGAAAAGDGTYRWDGKLVFQCTPRELPLVLAVLMGWREQTELRFHGEQRDKTLKLSRQPGGAYLELRAAGTRLGVPAGAADVYALGMLVLASLAANEPELSAQEVLAVCSAACASRGPEGMETA